MANKFRVQDGIVFPDGTELTSKSSDSIVNGDYSVRIQSDGSIAIPQGDGTQTNRGQIFSDNESSFINMDVQFNTDITGGMRLGTGAQKPVDIMTYANDEGGSKQWRFGVGGNLTLPTGAVLGDTEEDGGVTLKSSVNSYVELGSHDGNTYAWVADRHYYSGEESSFIIATAYTGADHRWKFDAYGNVTLPSSGAINDSAGLNLLNRLTNNGHNATLSSAGSLTIPGQLDILYNGSESMFLGVGPGGGTVGAPAGKNIAIAVDSNKTWFFNTDGSIQFPDNTIQRTAYDYAPQNLVNIDGGIASTNFPTNYVYVDCGGASRRGVLSVDTFDGEEGGAGQSSFDKVLNGGGA